MFATSAVSRPAALGLALALVLVGLGPAFPAAPTREPEPVKTTALETTHAVGRAGHVFSLAAGTTHIAIRWRGQRDAHVEAALSADGNAFGDPIHVELDEVGLARNDGETYGAVMTAPGMTAVRVTADRTLDQVTVLVMDAGAEVPASPVVGNRVAGATTIPSIIPRSGWGADETIRFELSGEERWTRAYFPLQKLIIHHTAGSNSDPNPAASVRAVYHYHAVTQGWGDIGYNYLIDSAGRIYEGRYSRPYWNGESPSSDNGNGLIVSGGHALAHNAGTMGIAFLGTFSTVAPTTSARNALVRLLAWASWSHGLNPTGSSTYVNPVTGLTRYVPNIAGHRSYNQTGCPGTALNNLLPTIRSAVKAAINSWPGETYNPARTLQFAAGTYIGYRFNGSGGITASKPYTLANASAAPTTQLTSIPNRSGTWYAITAGVWAGYWIQNTAGTTLAPGPAAPTGESFVPYRTLAFAPGTYVGRRFNTHGAVIASKPYTLDHWSAAKVTEKSTIPNQAGNWFYVTAGVWDGYWIQESAGTVLGDPPPPPPAPIATWDPPVRLWFDPGTYVGHRFDPWGVIVAGKAYTLTQTSMAPTRIYSTITNQTGNWYYITAGVWAGYWVREGPGITLETPPPPPTPIATYDPPQTLNFAAGTYTGRKFDLYGSVVASKPYTLSHDSSAPTTIYSTITNQAGNWYYITAGVWAGYWILESAGTTLASP